METARISSMCQIVIPKVIWEKVGLKAGKLVQVKYAEGKRLKEKSPIPEGIGLFA